MKSLRVINALSLALFFILVSVYFSWQLVGLRYTNHDDIYFNLYASVFDGNYLGFAKSVANDQARLQAYINMPIVLWASHFARSNLYDAINIYGMQLLRYL
jgi:hypothetical protein